MNRLCLTGVPWTEEEHRLFLIGLQKLGKGDWRGIARNYVMSRTPTQVASHAQKYFIRQSNATRRKRRSSLFDMVADDMVSLASKIISCFIILFLHDAYAGRQVALPVAKMHFPFRFALLPVS